MHVPADWWQNFFNGVAVEMWLRVPTEAMNRAEVDFLEKVLQLSSQSLVLDIPCGGGRHAIELASRGHQLAGVDISPEFLAAARTQAAKREIEIEWEQRDMRDLPWPGVFDAAYSLGNSFAYMEDAGNADFLKAVAGALKPGGRFVLNTGTVAEAILPNFQERRWYEIGDILFLIRNEHDHAASRLTTELTFVLNGQVEKRLHSQRIYTYNELCHLFADAGFEGMEGYGSPAMEPFKLGSQQLMLAATRSGS